MLVLDIPFDLYSGFSNNELERTINITLSYVNAIYKCQDDICPWTVCKITNHPLNFANLLFTWRQRSSISVIRFTWLRMNTRSSVWTHRCIPLRFILIMFFVIHMDFWLLLLFQPPRSVWNQHIYILLQLICFLFSKERTRTISDEIRAW